MEPLRATGRGLRGADRGAVLEPWIGHLDVWASAQNGLAMQIPTHPAASSSPAPRGAP